MIGELVGSYRIVNQIAVGGMGVVYRAEHTLIGRFVAVKILHPEMSGNRDVINRFFNEAKATTSIKHPGIVEVFDFGYLPSGHAYLVMEFLDGEALADRIRNRGVMPEGEAAILMRGVCSALAAAHAKGIVHRDLKPDNIFLVPDAESPLGERAKILDFGIAKLTDIGPAGSATKTGSVMGTPTYMSPEQCKGAGSVDHRADLYSIGCILYELVSGRPPFVHEGAGELIGSHLFLEPEPLSRHAPVSQEFEQLTMSLLRKDPAQRVQAANALAVHLVGIARQHGWADARTSMEMTPPAGTPQVYTPVFTPVPTPTPIPPRTPIRTPMPMPTPIPASAVMPTPIPSSGVANVVPPSLTPATTTSVPKPTTLSGSASESMKAVHGPRNRLFIAIGGGLLAAGMGIVVFVAVSQSSEHASTQPTAPSALEPTPAPPVVKMVAPTLPPAPSVAPTSPPPDAAVVTPAVAPETPVAETTTKPVTKPVKKPKKKTKPDKPTTTTTNPDLLETDI